LQLIRQWISAQLPLNTLKTLYKFVQPVLKKITFVFFIAISILIFALTLRGIQGNIRPQEIFSKLDTAITPFSVSPERGRYILTYNLVEHHKFDLFKDEADAAYPDVGVHNGKFYIFFAPGVSLLATPLYLLGKQFGLAQVGTFSLSAIFAILNLIFIFAISRKILNLPYWAALCGSLIFGYASCSWSYSITLYQHQVTTFLVLSGIYGAWLFKQKGKFHLVGGIWTWTAYAIAFVVDYPNVLLYLPVMLYFGFCAFNFEVQKKVLKISFKPAFVFCSLFFVLVSLGHGYYNLVNFGGVTKLSGGLKGYVSAIRSIQSDKQNKLTESEVALTDQNPASFFQENDFPNGLKVLSISSDRGLFFFFPIFSLSFLGIWKALKKPTPEIWVFIATLMTFLFLYSSWGDPWGGWAFGPRYLIPVMALSSLFISYWISSNSRSFVKKLITFLLFAFSCGVAILGAVTTNSVPPASEASALRIDSNFFYNFSLLLKNLGGGFVYNTYFKSHLSLWQYALMIYIPLLLIFAFVIFIMPKIKAYDD
jgi:hypothetical protein